MNSEPSTLEQKQINTNEASCSGIPYWLAPKFIRYESRELLLRLLFHAEAMTSAMIKEVNDSYEYYHYQMRYILRIHSSIRLAARRAVKTCIQEHHCAGPALLKEFFWEICVSNLYASMEHIGRFLDVKTYTHEVDLMYLRAEEVLALIVDVIDLMYTHVLCRNSLLNDEKRSKYSPLAIKTKQILEVLNRTVNMLRSKGDASLTNLTVIFRTAAEINLLNRLVVRSESSKLWPTETNVVRELIKKRIQALQTQLLFLSALDSDRENGLFRQIAGSALVYYERVAYRSLDVYYSPMLLCNDDSLAFSLIRDLSLALETFALHYGIQNYYLWESRAVHGNTLKKVSNDIYAAITAYREQLLLQESLPITSGSVGYGTCLNYIESAVHRVRTIKSAGISHESTMGRHLKILEKSLTESGELCASTFKNEAIPSLNISPSSCFDSEISVLDCFCNANRATSWNSIDEELCLQGRGGGGTIN